MAKFHLYFAEIEIGVGTGDRIFNITVDGTHWYGPLDIYSQMKNFVTDIVYYSEHNIISSELNVLLNVTNGSLFGPLWSAFELFKISDNPAISTTYIDDGKSLAFLVTHFGF